MGTQITQQGREDRPAGIRGRVALTLASVPVELAALALLATSGNGLDPAALQRQHIASCLTGLGLVLPLFAMVGPFRGPRSRRLGFFPRWWRPAARALCWATFALILAALALFVLAPAGAAERTASTIGLIASLLMIVAAPLAVCTLADSPRR